MVSLAPDTAAAVVTAPPVAPLRAAVPTLTTPALTAADYRRLADEAEQQEKRARRLEMPVEMWVGYCTGLFDVMKQTYLGFLRDAAADAHAFITRATALGRPDVADAITKLLDTITPAVDQAVFGDEPRYPGMHATDEEYGAWRLAYNHHQHRAVARARQRYVAELQTLAQWASYAAQEGDTGAAAGHAEVALAACVHVDPPTIRDAWRARTVADWRAVCAAEMAMVDATRVTGEDLEFPDDRAVEEELSLTIADALSRGEGDAARVLMDVLLQHGAAWYAADQPADQAPTDAAPYLVQAAA